MKICSIKLIMITTALASLSACGDSSSGSNASSSNESSSKFKIFSTDTKTIDGVVSRPIIIDDREFIEVGGLLDIRDPKTIDYKLISWPMLNNSKYKLNDPRIDPLIQYSFLGFPFDEIKESLAFHYIKGYKEAQTFERKDLLAQNEKLLADKYEESQKLPKDLIIPIHSHAKIKYNDKLGGYILSESINGYVPGDNIGSRTTGLYGISQNGLTFSGYMLPISGMHPKLEKTSDAKVFLKTDENTTRKIEAAIRNATDDNPLVADFFGKYVKSFKNPDGVNYSVLYQPDAIGIRLNDSKEYLLKFTPTHNKQLILTDKQIKTQPGFAAMDGASMFSSTEYSHSYGSDINAWLNIVTGQKK